MTNLQKQQALAIAYVTGQASPTEIARYRELLATDAGFRAVVRDIEAWLAPLNCNVDDVEPPPGLLEVILSDIAVAEQERGLPHPANVAAPTPAPIRSPRSNPWKPAALVASAVALLATAANFVDRPGSAPASTADAPQGTEALMALLSDETAPELIAVVYTPSDGRVVAQFSNIDVPDGKSLQLWLLRDGADSPRSLGLLRPVQNSTRAELDSTRAELAAPDDLRAGTDTLAVSLEDEGGSDSGAPQGPVLFSGLLWSNADR